jgi:hypothetical protein
VAEQLHVGPDVLAGYASAPRRGGKQLDTLARRLRFPHVRAPGRPRVCSDWLLPVALATTDAQGGRGHAHGRTAGAGSSFAGPSSVERLVAAALTRAGSPRRPPQTARPDARRRRGPWRRCLRRGRARR